MAYNRDQKEVEAVADLHGMTAEELRRTLQKQWSVWRGLRSVRIIHGQGTVLKPEVERWCVEMGIPFAPDPRNAGALRIFPRERTIPNIGLSTTLRDKGLRLTPEEEAYLRDPQMVLRARLEEQRRRQEEEQRKRLDAARHAAQKNRDESLWAAEIARLDSQDRTRSKGDRSEEKPGPPRILPPSEIKYQEGYWKAELNRVAGTDEQTLTQQKRTGLDRLAPPLEPKTETSSLPQKPGAPQRDEAADRSLFDAEMERLAGESDTNRR